MQKIFINSIISNLGISIDTISQHQAKQGELLQELIKSLPEKKSQLIKIYCQIYKVQYVDLESKDIPFSITNLITPEIAKKSNIIPIDKVGNHIIIATTKPRDLKLIDSIRFETGFTPKTVLSTEAEIAEAMDQYYSSPKTIDINEDASDNIRTTNKSDDREKIVASDKPNEGGAIINLVNQVLIKCATTGASDIHIEPYENFLRIRLRIDGVLHEIARPSSHMQAAIVSRFKILGALNIAEKRKPQDGNINVLIQDKPIDFRMNTVPTVFGEKIVLRILDKSALNVDLTKLGFEERDFRSFQKSIHKPFGMVVVTGPTGSGKTTTLYSALADLNKVSENIMTAEDPVEFTVPGINQVQVNPTIEFTFADALRAFLRQDPDIIMVGEIRDRDTGEIAIKAALTGHMVLSTLHTNSASDTITRLLNMGLEPFNVIAALTCVVAQRLARKICSNCKVENTSVTPEQLMTLGMPKEVAETAKVYMGEGCVRCSKTGYKGRTAIHEVLVMNDEIKDAILAGSSSLVLKKIAVKNGMKTLRQNALNKLLNGEIDIIEITKTTASDDD